MPIPKIVILGAGYGGIAAVLTLQKKMKAKEADIILINKNEYHYFTTKLHEPAAGTFPHNKARVDIKNIINSKKVKFIQDTVLEIRTRERTIILKSKKVEYDYLVIGLGSEPETFGIPGLMKYTFNRWNINSARQLKEHIDYQFATYRNEPERTELLTFVVAGAGFTGIEFVSELADRVPALCKEYDVDRELVRLFSIEANSSVLPGFEPDLVKYATAALRSKGVDLILGTPIKECSKEGVVLANGKKIKAGTVVWAAGVRGNSVIERSRFPSVRGRVEVDKYLRAPGYENVFVIGDCALVIDREKRRPYPPTAQIAEQMGKVIGENLAAMVRGNKYGKKAFTPVIRGTVASLGRQDAIGMIGRRKLTGYPAVVVKRFIDWRYLFMIGGVKLILKKGSF
jgi:NADH:ubiquinone reductase (H+-translocating)